VGPVRQQEHQMIAFKPFALTQKLVIQETKNPPVLPSLTRLHANELNLTCMPKDIVRQLEECPWPQLVHIHAGGWLLLMPVVNIFYLFDCRSLQKFCLRAAINSFCHDHKKP
jgi:hypothetical protein